MTDVIAIEPNPLVNPDLVNCNYIELYTTNEGGQPQLSDYGKILVCHDNQDKLDYILAQYNSHIPFETLNKLPKVGPNYKTDTATHEKVHGIFTALDDIGKALLRVFIPTSFYQVLLYHCTDPDNPSDDNKELQFSIQARSSLRDRNYLISIYLNSDPGVDDMSLEVHIDNKPDGQIVDDPHKAQIIPIGNLNRDHIAHELYSRNEFMNEGLVNGNVLFDAYRRMTYLGNFTEPKSPIEPSFSGTYTEPQWVMSDNIFTIEVSTGDQLYSALKYIQQTRDGTYVITQTDDIILNDLSTVNSYDDITIPHAWLDKTTKSTANITYNGNSHKIYGFLSDTSALFPSVNLLEVNDLLIDTGYKLVKQENSSNSAIVENVNTLKFNNIELHVDLVYAFSSSPSGSSNGFSVIIDKLFNGEFIDVSNYGSIVGFDDSPIGWDFSIFILKVLMSESTTSLKFIRCVNYGSIYLTSVIGSNEGSVFISRYDGTSSNRDTHLELTSCINYGSIDCPQASFSMMVMAADVKFNKVINNGCLNRFINGSTTVHPFIGHLSSMATLTYNKIYNNTLLTGDYNLIDFRNNIPKNAIIPINDYMLLKLDTDTSSLVYQLNEGESEKTWKTLEVGEFPVPYKYSKIHSI